MNILKYLSTSILKGLGLYLLLIFMGLILGGCIHEDENSAHDFYVGQCVQMKLDGLHGMVIYAYQYEIWVRFSSIKERTNTHILSGDADIEKSPFALVRVLPIELKHCEFK